MGGFPYNSFPTTTETHTKNFTLGPMKFLPQGGDRRILALDCCCNCSVSQRKGWENRKDSQHAMYILMVITYYFSRHQRFVKIFFLWKHGSRRSIRFCYVQSNQRLQPPIQNINKDFKEKSTSFEVKWKKLYSATHVKDWQARTVASDLIINMCVPIQFSSNSSH